MRGRPGGRPPGGGRTVLLAEQRAASLVRIPPWPPAARPPFPLRPPLSFRCSERRGRSELGGQGRERFLALASSAASPGGGGDAPALQGVAHACWGACRAPPACCCPSPAKPAAAAPCSGLELSFPRTKVSAGRLDRLFDTLLQPCDQSLGPGTRASQGLRPFCSAREQGGMSTGRWFPGRRPPLLAAWRARGGSSRCLAVACEGSGPTPLLW